MKLNVKRPMSNEDRKRNKNTAIACIVLSFVLFIILAIVSMWGFGSEGYVSLPILALVIIAIVLNVACIGWEIQMYYKYKD